MLQCRASWNSLSSVEARPRRRTVYPESCWSHFSVLAWSTYILRYLHLTEFFRSISIGSKRRKDSPEKKNEEDKLFLFGNFRWVWPEPCVLESRKSEKNPHGIGLKVIYVKDSNKVGTEHIQLRGSRKTSWRRQLFYCTFEEWVSQHSETAENHLPYRFILIGS